MKQIVESFFDTTGECNLAEKIGSYADENNYEIVTLSHSGMVRNGNTVGYTAIVVFKKMNDDENLWKV